MASLLAMVVLLAPQPWTGYTADAHVPAPPEGIQVQLNPQTCGKSPPKPIACTSYDGVMHIPKDLGRGTYYHETGHVFDLQTNLESEFLAIDNRETYDHAEAERFADAYRMCALFEGRITRHRMKSWINEWGSSWRVAAEWKANAACELIRE